MGSGVGEVFSFDDNTRQMALDQLKEMFDMYMNPTIHMPAKKGSTATGATTNTAVCAPVAFEIFDESSRVEPELVAHAGVPSDSIGSARKVHV